MLKTINKTITTVNSRLPSLHSIFSYKKQCSISVYCFLISRLHVTIPIFFLILKHSSYLGCPDADWVGDGYCDDIANNADCNYDGGDCCGSDINTQYCSECQCIESNTTNIEGRYSF